jgi:HK97 family phage major capsid protein
MTITEQVTQWSTTRAPKAARLAELMSKSADKGETLNDAEAQEFDGLELEIKSIDAQITRLRAAEALQAAPTPITPVTSMAQASAQRAGTPVITVKATVPPGTAFVRYTCAMLACKGNMFEASEYAARRWADSTPEVALQLKAAVAPGTVTDATWAGPLVNPSIAADFIELLRPATILGKIPGLRNVPFNTKVPSQTAGGTYGWVGEAKPKPVTKLAFSAETLGITKAAGIIILTEELVRLSNPSAEALARNDMIAGIARFLDSQFIDPAIAAVTGVNPASITNGAPTAAATTNPLADVMTLLNYFATNNVPIDGVTLIMSQANALALSFKNNSDGSPVFPGVGVNGGSFKGINIVTSQAAGTNVIGVQPSLILYADDGGVTIDMSREASVQMDSAPASPPDATTVLVSLWQNNLVGLRAERFVNWKRVGPSVMYLTAAAYPAPAELPPVTP